MGGVGDREGLEEGRREIEGTGGVGDRTRSGKWP